LEPLRNATHQIAPYKSNGVERALELSVYSDSCAKHKKQFSS